MDNVNFLTKRCIPTIKRTHTEHDHSVDNAEESNFEKLCKCLDEQTELLTLSELRAKMYSVNNKNYLCRRKVNWKWNTLFFIKDQYNWTWVLLILKIFLFVGYFVLNLFLFFPIFFIFYTTVVIYNTKNPSNHTTESQKEKKARLNVHFL